MGKSDSVVFSFYRNLLTMAGISASSNVGAVAFLGFVGPNRFTDSIKTTSAQFFDLQLGNFDINSPQWMLPQKYDLIICTRCCYFAQDPAVFISKCFEYLNFGGKILVDWGLGDHWRFKKFKIGWVRDGEHEYVRYAGKDRYLYSCLWKKSFETHPAVVDFFANTQKYGYMNRSLDEVILEEVPVVYSDVSCVEYIDFLSIWPESPQLYIAAVFA